MPYDSYDTAIIVWSAPWGQSGPVYLQDQYMGAIIILSCFNA